jgi:hypothetical protein
LSDAEDQRVTIILLGIRTRRTGDPPLTPDGKSFGAADRLRIVLRMNVEEFVENFPVRLNVEDRIRGLRLRKCLCGTVYVFGREAWKCLGLRPVPYFTRSREREQRVTYTLLPHPSGRNLMYNDPETCRRVRRLLCHKS